MRLHLRANYPPKHWEQIQVNRESINGAEYGGCGMGEGGAGIAGMFDLLLDVFRLRRRMVGNILVMDGF
jgi:hypothetical protein